MACALPSRSTTVVESGGGLTITVLRSVLPQAAKARQTSNIATAGRMAISLELFTQGNASDAECFPYVPDECDPQADTIAPQQPCRAQPQQYLIGAIDPRQEA